MSILDGPMLPGGPLPDSFECVVRGRLRLAEAIVELHDYRFHRPQHALFMSPRPFVDLAFSSRAGHANGRYVDAPALGARAMGDIIFIPGGRGLASEWDAGVQSSICCQFLTDGERDEWSAPELAASLDVRSPFVRDTLIRLRREIEEPGFGSDIMAEAICLQLGVELGRYFRSSRAANGAPGSRLGPAQLRRIDERLACPGPLPGVAELAAECGVSARQFFRLFRATTGTTLGTYAAERQIARAKTMLAGERAAVKQIAWACGFATAAAFSSAFRRATGCSPREFRRQRDAVAIAAAAEI